SVTAAITFPRGRWLRSTALPLLMQVATFSNPASVSASRSGAVGSWVAPPTPRNSRMNAVLARVAVMVASFLRRRQGHCPDTFNLLIHEPDEAVPPSKGVETFLPREGHPHDTPSATPGRGRVPRRRFPFYAGPQAAGPPADHP